MSRFVWVDNKELCDELLGLGVRPWGREKYYSYYDDEDEGFIYDRQECKQVMNFGNNQNHYPTCGIAPDKQFLDIIMNALNNHEFNKESK
jgi:hypothetical protein